MNKTITTISCIVLLLSSVAHAQTTEEEAALKWYQVELFIFANNNPDDADQESWQQDLGLNYPANIVSLNKDPGTVLPALEDTAYLANENHSSQTSDGSTVAEQPFILLTPEQHQLTDIVNRILSRADFRLLFHQAWRQPIANSNDAANILIQAGDQFDSHYELEGSINLSVERYLHINTDLWLSTFVSAVGREQAPWPVLPKAPLMANAETNTPNPTTFGINQTASMRYFENPFLDIVDNQYAVDRTIALRQHRRMRSNELHYIDHPLMGLLIKITPYNPEQEIEQDTSLSPAAVTATPVSN